MIQKEITNYKVQEYVTKQTFEAGLKQMDGKGFALCSFCVYMNRLETAVYCAVFARKEVVNAVVIGGDWEQNRELEERLEKYGI